MRLEYIPSTTPAAFLGVIFVNSSRGVSFDGSSGRKQYERLHPLRPPHNKCQISCIRYIQLGVDELLDPTVAPALTYLLPTSCVSLDLDQGAGPRTIEVPHRAEESQGSDRDQHQEARHGVLEAQEDVRAAEGPSGRAAVQHRADVVRDRLDQGHRHHGMYTAHFNPQPPAILLPMSPI